MAASSAPPPAAGDASDEFSARQGMRMVMTNQFAALEHRFLALEAKKDPSAAEGHLRIRMIQTYFRFLQAMSSFGTTDLERALEVAWASESVASAQVKASATGWGGLKFWGSPSREQARAERQKAVARIEGQLSRADCYLLAAVVQLVKQSFVKGGWNIRKSWKYYESAQAAIAQLREQLRTAEAAAAGRPASDPEALGLQAEAAELADLLGWADFGVGLFQLLVSLLPPAVLQLARWVGMPGGDRPEGLRLLRNSQSGPSFVGPLAAILLLSWDLAISHFTGQQEPEQLRDAEELLRWADREYPGGLFFRFFRSRLLRSQLRTRAAIREAELGLRDCGEMPALAIIFLYQQGWCAFFLRDWVASAGFFMPLLPQELQRPVPVSARMRRSLMLDAGEAQDPQQQQQQPPQAQGGAAVGDGSPATAAIGGGGGQDDGSGGGRDIKPTKATAQALYAFQIALCLANAGRLGEARFYFSRVRALCGDKQRPLEGWAAARAEEWLERARPFLPDSEAAGAGEEAGLRWGQEYPLAPSQPSAADSANTHQAIDDEGAAREQAPDEDQKEGQPDVAALAAGEQQAEGAGANEEEEEEEGDFGPPANLPPGYDRADDVLNTAETIFLWNGFAQMPPPKLRAAVRELHSLWVSALPPAAPAAIPAAIPAAVSAAETADEPRPEQPPKAFASAEQRQSWLNAQLAGLTCPFPEGPQPAGWPRMRLLRFHMLLGAAQLELGNLKAAELQLAAARVLSQRLQQQGSPAERLAEERDGPSGFVRLLSGQALLLRARRLPLMPSEAEEEEASTTAAGRSYNSNSSSAKGENAASAASLAARHAELLEAARAECRAAQAAGSSSKMLLFKGLQVRIHGLIAEINAEPSKRRKRAAEALARLEQEIEGLEELEGQDQEQDQEQEAKGETHEQPLQQQ